MAGNARRKVDGGWGWVVVFAGMVVYLIVFGTLRCQSVLFVHIVGEFKSDFSTVAWVSSIATAGFSFAGLLAAPLINKIGHRWTVILGGSLAAVGTVLGSFAPDIVLLDLTVGGLAGVGMGIAFVPSPVIIGHYFQKRRSLAINIASVGASVGTLAVCPLNEVITDAYTLRGYFLVYSAVLLNICVAGMLMRPPPAAEPIITSNSGKESGNVEDQEESLNIVIRETNVDAVETPPQAHEKILFSETQQENKKSEAKCCQRCSSSPLLKNRSYIIYCASQIVFLAGFLCNQLYIVPYAIVEAGIPKIQASLLMSIGAFVEIFSRLIFGFLGDVKRIDRIWLFTGVLFILSVCAAILPLMKTFGSIAAMTAITGLFQGGFSGMSVVILADIVGLKLYAQALGISTLLNGIGTLVTPPAAGRFVDATGLPSTALFISAGILFVGAVLSAMIKVSMIYDAPRRDSNQPSGEANQRTERPDP